MTVHQKMENGVSGLFLGDSFNSERVLELVQTSSSTELRNILDKIRADNDVMSKKALDHFPPVF